MVSFRNETRTAAILVGVKHAELLDENCAIARAGAIVGERWVWVILRQAFNGAKRFEEFQRGIGLARNVLTDRLGWLVEPPAAKWAPTRDAIVARSRHATSRSTVESLPGGSMSASEKPRRRTLFV